MADFASRYMNSKGWKDGDGLGKKRDGRKDPVKVKYKFDINGLGHDKAEVDKYKWWEHAFKTAADSIQVGKDNKVEKIEGKATIVSTSRPLSKSLNRALLYGSHFVRKGVLEGGKFTNDSDSDSSDSDSDDDSPKTGKIVEISDEALFAACGGMTGHKGARHGINMTAKLARIKQQEIEGLNKFKKLQNKNSENEPKPQSPKSEETPETEEEIPKKKKSKKSKRKAEAEPEVVAEIEISPVSPEGPKKKKSKKSKKKAEVEPEVAEIEVEPEVPKKKKNKKKSKKVSETPETEEKPEEKPKKRKRKKEREMNESENAK